jgi:6-phosphogluconate dehydrogenase
MLMRQAAVEYKWELNYAGIALMWRGGCIIKRWVASSRPQRR